MSHEEHHDTHHQAAETKPTTSFRSSVWFMIILAGLFVAAVNFVNVMSHDEGEGHGEHGTEHVEAVTTHEAAAGHEEAHATEAVDTAHAEEAHATEAPAEHH
jgi:hypothetical protein